MFAELVSEFSPFCRVSIGFFIRLCFVRYRILLVLIRRLCLLDYSRIIAAKVRSCIRSGFIGIDGRNVFLILQSELIRSLVRFIEKIQSLQIF